jgi:hypothetical protein
MGAKYVGQFKDDKKNGQGTLTLANGVKYVRGRQICKDNYFCGDRQAAYNYLKRHRH